MANNESRIPRAANVSGVETPDRHLCHGRRATPAVRHAPQIETHADQPALELNTMDNDSGSEYNFHAIADRVMSEERPALHEATWVTALTSEKLLVFDALAGIPVHVKESLTKMTTEPNANSSGTESHLAALLDRLVLQAVDTVLRTPATLGKITASVLDNPSYLSPVVALLRLEHSLHTTEQANNNARCRQFVELGAKIAPSLPAWISEQVEEPPADITDDVKTNPRALSWSRSQSSSEWYEERPRKVAKVGNNRFRKHR